jgi:hypothetical protein
MLTGSFKPKAHFAGPKSDKTSEEKSMLVLNDLRLCVVAERSNKGSECNNASRDKGLN